jgi:adenylate cyclase
VYVGLDERERLVPAARRAVEAVELRLRHDPDDARALALGAGAYVHLGERDRAMQCLDRSLELYPDELSPLYNAACTYAQMGDKERALAALERAFAGGRGARKWVENDRDLDPLRGEPRFQKLLLGLRD